jgi:predicted phosphodiesterase
VIVVAGDARQPGSLALRAVRELFPDRSKPLIYVPGNHDFYSSGIPMEIAREPEAHTTYEVQRARMAEVGAELNITLLDDGAVIIDDVRFCGGTLWTDFSARPPHVMFGDAVRAAERGMNDYRKIKTGKGRSRDRLRVGQTLDAHKATVRFIESILAEPHDGDTVVVTHHAPSWRSLAGYDHDANAIKFHDLDWCYASDLERLMRGDNAPALWIHGHIHAPRDYTVGRTRVVANPRGYPMNFMPNAPRENPNFDPALIVEIGHDYTPAWRI